MLQYCFVLVVKKRLKNAGKKINYCLDVLQIGFTTLKVVISLQETPMSASFQESPKEKILFCLINTVIVLKITFNVFLTKKILTLNFCAMYQLC